MTRRGRVGHAKGKPRDTAPPKCRKSLGEELVQPYELPTGADTEAGIARERELISLLGPEWACPGFVPPWSAADTFPADSQGIEVGVEGGSSWRTRRT